MDPVACGRFEVNMRSILVAHLQVYSPEPKARSFYSSGFNKKAPVRTVTVSRFAELASKFFPELFPPTSCHRFDELSGTRKAFSRVVTDADRLRSSERANCYGRVTVLGEAGCSVTPLV